MAECNWDPSKHGGRVCPIHGDNAETNKPKNLKVRINKGKYQIKTEDGNGWEDVSRKEYEELRQNGKQEFDADTENEEDEQLSKEGKELIVKILDLNLPSEELKMLRKLINDHTN